MKKNFLRPLSTALCCTTLVLMVAGCGKSLKTSGSKDTPVDVTLNEVAHSIFYAPMYIAIEQGYFEQEGINLSLVTGFGADKTMTAVLSGEADIGFMGPETTVYTVNEGSNDYVVNFAQLTQRAGNFLVAREEMPSFSWADLCGKEVLGGRKGGMPSHDVTWEHMKRKPNLTFSLYRPGSRTHGEQLFPVPSRRMVLGKCCKICC